MATYRENDFGLLDVDNQARIGKLLLGEKAPDKPDNVPRCHYNAAIKELEDERISHANTRKALMDTQDKLDFAQGEIEVLKKQIEREKEQFERTFGMLRNKALKETVKSVELETRCSAIEKECVQREGELGSKDQQIVELREKLAQQEKRHKQELQELKVMLQQEAYIARTMHGDSGTSGHRKSASKISVKRR